MVPETSVFNADLIREKLGLTLEDLTPQLATRYGLGAADGFVITGVLSGGPAAAARLERGILVAAIDGQSPPDLTAVAKLLYAKKTGDRVLLDVWVRERMGNFIGLRRGTVELATR
jgi:S1-C subfamily serine protease